MELKKKIVSSNNLLFSFTNVYPERELMRSIMITLRIIIYKCEEWSSKQGFRRNILPFNFLPMWGSLNIELNWKILPSSKRRRSRRKILIKSHKLFYGWLSSPIVVKLAKFLKCSLQIQILYPIMRLRMQLGCVFPFASPRWMQISSWKIFNLVSWLCMLIDPKILHFSQWS